MTPGLFEVLAADENDVRLANRKALVLAETRLDRSLGKFLGASQSPEEFDARFDYVKEDFEAIVRAAADEVGHEKPAALMQTLHAHYRNASFQKGSPDAGDDKFFGGEGGSEKAFDAMKDEYGDDKGEEVYYKTRNKKKGKGKKSSVSKESRRPKMCPYHNEVVDIALATGNPQSGFEVMQPQAWSENHCQGTWDGGKCKFQSPMVNQSFWDDRNKQENEQRQQRDQRGQENVTDLNPDPQGDHEPDHMDLENAEVIDFPSDGGSEGGDAPVAEPVADAPLAEAVSKVARRPWDDEDDDHGPADSPEGDSESDHAWSDLQRSESEDDDEDDDTDPRDKRLTRTAKGADDGDSSSQKSESLPSAKEDSNTGLGGPSPKIDKGKSRKPGDTGWSLKPIDVPSNKNPTEQKDVMGYDRPEYVKDSVKDNVKEIGEKTTETQDLPTADRNLDDSGFAGNNMEMAPHTDQWGKGTHEVEPVTNATPLETVSHQRWSPVEA